MSDTPDTDQPREWETGELVERLGYFRDQGKQGLLLTLTATDVAALTEAIRRLEGGAWAYVCFNCRIVFRDPGECRKCGETRHKCLLPITIPPQPTEPEEGECERLSTRLRAMARSIPKNDDENVYDSVDLKRAADILQDGDVDAFRRGYEQGKQDALDPPTAPGDPPTEHPAAQDPPDIDGMRQEANPEDYEHPAVEHFMEALVEVPVIDREKARERITRAVEALTEEGG